MVHIDLRVNSGNSRFLNVTVKSSNEKPRNCIFKVSTKSILDSVDILEIHSLNLSYDIYGYLADELSSWLFHLEISPKSRNQKPDRTSVLHTVPKNDPDLIKYFRESLIAMVKCPQSAFTNKQILFLVLQ